MGLIATTGGSPTSAMTSESELSCRPDACQRLRSGSGNWPTVVLAEANDAGEYMAPPAGAADGCTTVMLEMGVCGEGVRASLGAEQPAIRSSIPVTPRLRHVRKNLLDTDNPCSG